MAILALDTWTETLGSEVGMPLAWLVHFCGAGLVLVALAVRDWVQRFGRRCNWTAAVGLLRFGTDLQWQKPCADDARRLSGPFMAVVFGSSGRSLCCVCSRGREVEAFGVSSPVRVWRPT